jgi:hypothetical protein
LKIVSQNSEVFHDKVWYGTAHAERNKGYLLLQDVHIMDGSEQEDRDLKVSIQGFL